MGVGEEMEGQEERSVTEERTEGAEGISSSPHTQTPMEEDKSNIYR